MSDLSVNRPTPEEIEIDIRSLEVFIVADDLLTELTMMLTKG